MYGRFAVPEPSNEPVRSYAPGSPERASIKDKLAEVSSRKIDIPIIIGGEEFYTDVARDEIVPHDHGHVLATYHRGSRAEIERAIESCVAAQEGWANTPWTDRAAIFLRAAELLATTWRDTVNAATMLGQSKTIYQAEIDSACELIDFWRFNVAFAEEIYESQPLSSEGVWNRMEYRPLEGFVYAISPFNFTAIGGNLVGSPALMGNTVLWKPSAHAVLSSYYVFRILEEAGLPPGVINFVPGDPVEVTKVALSHPSFAGLHFTGSTAVFQEIWRTVGERIDSYRTYPRLVGETGGKDFLIAHPSAHREALKTAIIRGAFEYQGQKCSALSRAYIPESIWTEIEQPLLADIDRITMGDPTDFGNFVSAIIHKRAFDDISGYIERARESSDAEILVGGECDDSKGYFIRPTVIRANRPDYESVCDEIFGPVLTVYVYPDAEWSETLDLVDSTSPYALTGCVFAQDRGAAQEATDRLRFAAGNFYVNDKPTGAVVGNQPFGGSRASGTNDKAGSPLNLLRWVSPRVIKETLVPPTDYRYPFMDAE